jgi:transposase
LSIDNAGKTLTLRIHSQARTTPKIRQEIKDSGLSDREAAKVFNITRATAAKWLKRDDGQLEAGCRRAFEPQ